MKMSVMGWMPCSWPWILNLQTMPDWVYQIFLMPANCINPMSNILTFKMDAARVG